MRNHYYLPLVERKHQNRVNTKQGNLILARRRCLPMFSALGLFFLCSKGIMQYLRGDKNILTNWNFLLNTNRRVEKRKRKKLCPGLKPSLNCLPPLTPTEFEMFLQHSNKYVQCARILGLELRTKVGTEDTFLEESAWSRWVRFQKWIMSTGREHNVEEEMAWGRATHTHTRCLFYEYILHVTARFISTGLGLKHSIP